MQRKSRSKIAEQPGRAETRNTTFNVLPNDMKRYLLSFCSLADVGKLAQVDTALHDLINHGRFTNQYEKKSNFYVPMTAHGKTKMMVKSGYVKGSYAELHDFFESRSPHAQAVAELDKSFLIDKKNIDQYIFAGKVITVANTALYFSIAPMLAITIHQNSPTANISDIFQGLIYLTDITIAACSLTTIGIFGCIIVENKQEKRDSIRREFLGQPNQSLFGETFSWDPTEKHDAAPTIRMTE